MRHDTNVRLKVSGLERLHAARSPRGDFLVAPFLDHGGGTDQILGHLLLPCDDDAVKFRGCETHVEMQ